MDYELVGGRKTTKRGFETIGQIVGELKRLKSSLDTKKDVSELGKEFEGAVDEARKLLQIIGVRTNIDQFFNSTDLGEIIDSLGDLSTETKIEEIAKERGEESVIEPESDFNKLTLDELVEEYEKAGKEKKTKIREEIVKVTGKKDVEQFIRTQRELAAKAKEETLTKVVEDYREARPEEREKIKEKIHKKTGVKDVEKFVERYEEVLTKDQVALERFPERIREEIALDVAVIGDGEEEKVRMVIEEMALKDEAGKREVDKALRIVKNKEERERLVQKIEEVRARVAVENEAEKISQTVFSKLKDGQSPVSKNDIEELRNNILEAWRVGDSLEKPVALTEVNGGETILAEAGKAVDGFKANNLETVVNYRRLELGNRIGERLRENGVQNEALIGEYSEVVNEIWNNPRVAYQETNTSVIVDNVRSTNTGKGEGQIKRSVEEAEFTLKSMGRAPRKYNETISKYEELREKIGSDKLPKIKEVRVMEKMTAMFKDNPRILRAINGAQKMVGLWEKTNALPGNLLVKIGAKDAGMKVLGKVGGQLAVDFMTNASIVIAEQGTMAGIKSIATALFTKGAVIAGEGAAGTSLAAMATIFSGLPVIGQIAIAVTAVVMVVKPVVDAVKNFFEDKLKINLRGVKNFIAQDLGLGKFVGSVGQFAFDLGALLIGLPALITAASFTAIVAPVFMFFVIGILVYSTLQQNLVSSLVPPSPMGGGNCVLQSVAEEEGMINCNQNAPANDFSGISRASFVGMAGRWTSGKNYSEECFNDTVNRALCAGINPEYALWAWLHESGASNYSIDDVEDFGIHGQPSVPAKNFNAQINWFLKLNPGNACLGEPGIGDNYWLSFATNYLTGGCDPNKAASNGATGYSYYEEMETTWGWLYSHSMPDDIFVEKGGQNCGSLESGGSDTPLTNSYVDEDGNTWICYGESGNDEGIMPNFEPWDTSIPVPEGCPSMLPAAGYFTQGPFAQSCSHQNMSSPAIDIGAGNGTPIVATHPGVAVLNHDSVYGFYIDIHGRCEGKDFYTRYAHMPNGGYRIGNNETVSAGQTIGVVNNTGSSSGPHLHYHISGLETSKFGQYLGLSVSDTQQLWGCCGSWNGKYCP